jgi:DNA-binding transcriptional LysR family regulator
VHRGVRQYFRRGTPPESSSAALSRHLRLLEEHSGAALLRRNTHRISLTPIGQRLLADAQTILGYAEAASHCLREDQTTLSGQLRLFATIDLGQSIGTRLVSSFLQSHPNVTAELSMTNRPLHMIQEGCDVGILPGKITDENVIARPAGKITLSLAASPSLIKSRRTVKQPGDLKSWPWISLSGVQFGSSEQVTLFTRNQAEQTLHISPVLFPKA